MVAFFRDALPEMGTGSIQPSKGCPISTFSNYHHVVLKSNPMSAAPGVSKRSPNPGTDQA